MIFFIFVVSAVLLRMVFGEEASDIGSFLLAVFALILEGEGNSMLLNAVLVVALIYYGTKVLKIRQRV